MHHGHWCMECTLRYCTIDGEIELLHTRRSQFNGLISSRLGSGMAINGNNPIATRRPSARSRSPPPLQSDLLFLNSNTWASRRGLIATTSPLERGLNHKTRQQKQQHLRQLRSTKQQNHDGSCYLSFSQCLFRSYILLFIYNSHQA